MAIISFKSHNFYFLETSDDILAKYRKPTTSPMKLSETGSGHEAASNQSKEKEVRLQVDDVDGTPANDASSLDNCKAFMDAKKKVRLFL